MKAGNLRQNLVSNPIASLIGIPDHHPKKFFFFLINDLQEDGEGDYSVCYLLPINTSKAQSKQPAGKEKEVKSGGGA